MEDISAVSCLYFFCKYKKLMSSIQGWELWKSEIPRYEKIHEKCAKQVSKYLPRFYPSEFKDKV